MLLTCYVVLLIGSIGQIKYYTTIHTFDLSMGRVVEISIWKYTKCAKNNIREKTYDSIHAIHY